MIGTDPFGYEMVKIMEASGINSKNLITQAESWSTHVYTKPYVEGVEEGRIDFGNFNELSEETASRLIDLLVDDVPEMDVIIINQQVTSGIHTPYFREKLVGVIRRFPEKIFIVDSRDYNEVYEGAYRKMNDLEAVRLIGLEKEHDEMVHYSEVKEAALSLYKRFKKPLFITRGARGSIVVDKNGVSDMNGLMILARVDTVGAGDSYLAGAAATLAAGYCLHTAAEIGSYVAGVTIQKLFQTGTASPKEIMEIGVDPDFVYNVELAENIRDARFWKNSEIEIINDWERPLQIKHAIFDHDGTISTLREGWEEIMVPMMMKAILGEHHDDADESLYEKVHAQVVEFVDKTTGIQTLVQMQGLTGLVKEFGLVPKEQILDEFGYKEIYNKELLAMVKKA